MNKRRTIPLEAVPIDDAARNGRYQLVFSANRYALVRWVCEQWVFPSGNPFPEQPTHYQHRKDRA